jgi:methylglyoxal synthase
MQNKKHPMQTHCLLNLSDKARLIGCNGDSGVRNAEKPSLHPSTRLIPSRKRIALVAHDKRKEKMACWALKHRTRLIEHELYATAHTADIIAEVLNAPVFRFLSGPLGGDQQIGSRIAESRIDVLIFFWDPLGHQPHDSDVKALLRLATAWNIPNACNEATADCIISSPLFDAEPQAVSESPNQNLLQMWRQSGLGLGLWQFGQKRSISQKLAFIGVWALWKARLDVGAADP